MKKHITYLAAALVLFSCTKTEIEEVEVERIVEVPTAVELAAVSLATSTSMTNESDEQVIIVSAAIASTLDNAAVINLNFSGSAELDSDYSVSSTAINIPAGELTGTTEITIISDSTYESGVENIVVSLAGLPNTVTPSGNGSAVQIDITDGDAIVAFSQGALTIEEDSFYSLDVELSKALNDDIVVYYEGTTTNDRYGVNGNFVIIPAGETRRSISVDANDSRITPSADLAMAIAITSVENENVVIGTNGTISITTTEADAGLQINAAWPTQSDLFELYIFDATGSQVRSSTNGGNTESILLSDNAFSPLANGTYTIELDDFNFSSSSAAEVVTFEFFDEMGATFGGPYTFTVNNPGDRIPVLSLEVLDGVYTVTQTNTAN